MLTGGSQIPVTLSSGGSQGHVRHLTLRRRAIDLVIVERTLLISTRWQEDRMLKQRD